MSRVLLLVILLSPGVVSCAGHTAAPSKTVAGRSCSGGSCVLLDTVRTRSRLYDVSVRGYRYLEVVWDSRCPKGDRLNTVIVDPEPFSTDGRGVGEIGGKYEMGWMSGLPTGRGREQIPLRGKPRLLVSITAIALTTEGWEAKCQVHVRIRAFRS